jgi:hypothetical protein
LLLPLMLHAGLIVLAHHKPSFALAGFSHFFGRRW